MSAIPGIVALLTVLAVGLLITRIATCMLTFTGLSPDLARFQARSAFTGCGFTTSEAERIAEHPVRRRIVMVLMLMGNGTVVLAITSLVPVMIGMLEEGANTAQTITTRILTLALGLLALWMFASSKWVDRQLFSITKWALKRFTKLEVKDYVGLLHISRGYTINEIDVAPGDWVAGKSLVELRLGDEGVQVLGIRRSDGSFVGAPTGRTYFRNGDRVILYGLSDVLADLDSRKAGPEGDEAHRLRSEEQQRIVEEQTIKDQRGLRNGATDEPPAEPDEASKRET